MGVPMLFRIILVLWSVIVFAQAASLAKSSCQDRCGNVSVPFPFGIGDGCYVDDWFAIVCNGYLGSPRPFLRSFKKLEVLEIQLDGTVRVKYPTARSCTKNETGVDNVLEESPFVFSQSKNRFTVMGCNNYASMKSLDSTVTYGGCSSRCERGSMVIFNVSSCNGINCCQIAIPSDLSAFTTDLDQIIQNDTSQECRYAFLVEQEWFETNNVVPNVYSVPVVLEWGIHSTSFHSLLPVRYNSISSDTSRTSNCSVHSPLESNQNLSFSCSCQYGYEGNPYLLGGCQDINECEAPDGNPCLKQWLKDSVSSINYANYSCENTDGSYACHMIPYTQDPSKSKSMKLIIKGISLGLGPLLLFGGGWLSYEMVKKWKMIKRREKFFKRNGGLLLQQQLSSNEVKVESTKLFNSKDLEKATDGFNANRILGKGGQSTVYKGMLVDGGIVAVKKSKVKSTKENSKNL